MFDLKEILSKRGDLSDDDLKRTMECFIPETYKAKSLFLEQGKISDKLALIKTGILRSFFYDDNANDITTQFFKPGHVVISIQSFNNQIPTKENIDVLEEAELMVISYDKMQELTETIPVWKQIAKQTDEIKFQSQMNRSIKFQTMTTKERYIQFCEKHPDIIQKVALRHIASYLGMDIATLSRIRKSI